MASVPLPKAARGAVFVAFVIALVTGISVRSGPIMLLAVCIVALLSAIGILRRRVWSAYGFALLLAISILAMLFFALTGQNSGSFLQILVSIVLYSGIAGLFFLAGLSLKVEGAKMGSPIPWILIALLLSIPFVLFRPVSVPSGAMEDTLQIGDFVLVDRFSSKPKLGDIIAFHTAKDPQQIAIRRVVGLPGDHIRIANGTLYRDGQPVPEPYVTRKGDDAENEVIVPANKYLVLGDARNKSSELVEQNNIVGKPKFVYDSLAPDPADLTAQKDLGEPNHPPIRRWDRVFKTL